MTDDALPDADQLFRGPCAFVSAAADPEGFPPVAMDAMPEVAFVGRSNVGKSSLINALTGRAGLARASNTPGRTQQIIFFNLGGRLMLADLPGYGHADAPRPVRLAWERLMDYYLATRPTLRCVLLLLDARRGVMASDHAMMDRLDRAGVAFRAILTKIDKLRPAEQDKVRATVEAQLKRHHTGWPTAHATSSEKNAGITALRETLASFV